MKVQVLFAWYDIWIGVFYDKKKNWWYILPIPMIGIILKLPENWRISIVVVRFKRRIAAWKDQRELARKKRVLEIEFHKLKWTNDQVWNMTKHSCGCLDDAVRLLANRLMNHCSENDGKMNDGRLFHTAKELVLSGFDRKWEN